MKTDGTFEEITKKEGLMLEREQLKLEQTLGGIANMNRLPGAIFVVDTIKENIAMNEAVKLNIPIIALVDTNSDPDIPDYIIPANDDSARTIQLLTSLVADAIIEGNAEREAMKEEELMEQAAVEAKIDSDDSADEDSSSEKPNVKRRTRKRKKTDGGSKKTTEVKKSNDTPKSETPKEDTAKAETPKEDTAKSEAPKEDAAKAEAPKEDSAKKEAPKEDESPAKEENSDKK